MAKPPRQAAWVDQLGRWIRPARPAAGPGRKTAPTGRRLALGLQGGGALGAFTWGVLDRLLEEPDLPLSAVSGASAGAVNGAVLVSAWTRGGPDGARQALERLWRRLSEKAGLSRPGWLPGLGQSAGATALDVTSRLFSPYQLNPLDLNPLREILADEVDFTALVHARAPELIIAATRISDGAPRLFRRGEITLDAIIASACLPLIHHTVEIAGEPYWDGGYAANPPLIPLVHTSDAAHLLVVQVTPTASERLPKTPREIERRLERIQFNATLNAELEAIKLGIILRATPKMRRLRIGRISAQDEFAGLENESPADLGREFLDRLWQSGRGAVETWLEQAGPLGPREGRTGAERWLWGGAS